MKNVKKALLSAIILFSCVTAGAGTDPLKYLPVQDGGRIKPFDSFAREYLALIFGKEKFEGKPAHEIVFTWVLQPQLWQEKKMVEIRHSDLKKGLKLDPEQMHFSMRELLSSERLAMLLQDLASKRETKEKLDPYYQAVSRLESQIVVFREIGAGRMVRVVPVEGSANWKGLDELSDSEQEKFLEVTKAFVEALTDPAKEQNLKAAIQSFTSKVSAEHPETYTHGSMVEIEVHYNDLHPFRWAWIFYLIGSLTIFYAWIRNQDSIFKWSFVFLAIGFLLHCYGFGLRIWLTGRPPVSNMYETVVWVGFGSLIFGAVIEWLYRWKFVLLSGSLVAALCLVLADMAPAVLDPTLQPLEPVLRSNFWLLVHVMTITISYAAFFLAFMLGDIGLYFCFVDEEKHREKIKAIVLSIYRSIQIGVALLGPGIILGGIWADYSWGRFWGWDPKETWALIALLGYIAVLHGKIVGWIKDFGMICSAIVAFSLIIMAWYGVNFVLGAGLHSYGFGAGGVEYVSTFVAIHLLCVIFVSVVRSSRQKSKV